MNTVPHLLMIMLDDMPAAVKIGAGIIVCMACFFVFIFGLGKVMNGLDERPINGGKVIMGGIQALIAIMIAAWILLP